MIIMQNPNTVKLADVSPETRDKVHLFLRKTKLMHPDKHIKTLEDAILFAIEQTENMECIQASGELKEVLDTFREKDVKKETYEEIIWKLIWKVKDGMKDRTESEKCSNLKSQKNTVTSTKKTYLLPDVPTQKAADGTLEKRGKKQW